MNLIDASLLITAGFFSLYGLACALECGVALSLLFNDNPRTRSLFSPMWEVTNVFLVFGFTALSVLFSGSLQKISHALLSTLAVAFIALLLRGCVVLKIFYLNDGKLKKPEALIFLLTNFAIPLSFIAGGAYLLTGKLFWHTTIGWLIMAAAVVGLSGLGLAFVNQTKNRLTPTMILAVWFAIIGCLLPLKISHGGSLASGPILGLTILGFVGLMGLVIDSIKTNRRLVLLTAGLVGLGTPLLLAWSNRPYLIHQQITLAGAYSAAAYAGIFIVSLVIMLPLLILGGILFYKLLKIQAKS